MIGVAIATHNRNEVLKRNLIEHRRFQPPGSVLFVVDDASEIPFEGADHRFDQNVGVARAKNKGLELLYDAGCEHFFLFDDDSYPVTPDWWEPYVSSREPHLMSVFITERRSWSEIIYQDSEIRAMSRAQGYMLYAERVVLDIVGGMDPAFGRWGWEHISWSNRIHAAGLTSFRYADVQTDKKLIHAMDERGELARSVPQDVRKRGDLRGFKINEQYRDTPHYVEFRAQP
jgi:hypothetical protein